LVEFIGTRQRTIMLLSQIRYKASFYGLRWILLTIVVLINPGFWTRYHFPSYQINLPWFGEPHCSGIKVVIVKVWYYQSDFRFLYLKVKPMCIMAFNCF